VEHLELGAKKNWCGATLVVSGDWHPFGPSQQRKMVGSSSTTCGAATEGGPMAGTGPEPLEVSSTRSVGAGRGGGGPVGIARGPAWLGGRVGSAQERIYNFHLFQADLILKQPIDGLPKLEKFQKNMDL
jgi:hypothetical protein